MIPIHFADRESREQLFAALPQAPSVAQPVQEIIDRVRREGDAALMALTERFDGVRLSALRVSEQEMDEATRQVDEKLLATMTQAAKNIRAFHSQQMRVSFVVHPRPGVTAGQRVVPLERVGLYVPGGTAAYPSTVLMNAIPAAIAGCKGIAIATPPGRDGRVNPAILAAARLAGVQEVYKVGGAQAIAALAWGTESIPRVDKIVGPGNAYVAEAKRQAFGQVAIDMIAGPSEILIVADGGSDPRCLAADMLSQAEHDKLASAVLVTDSRDLAQAVQQELERQVESLPRREIARASIDSRSSIIVTGSIGEAVDIANRIAPEHLELCLDNPFDWLDKVRHAGSVFLGRSCPEAMGDYFAGTNHTLPTGGTARFASALSVDDFVKRIQFSYYTPEALRREAADVARFARAEGLEAHARSVESRLEGDVQP
jgi:histidinol dehydrogenase